MNTKESKNQKGLAQKEKEVQNLIGFTSKEKIGLSVLLALIVAAPYLLTQFSTGISFIDTGEIGDTIGGITAPFVNLLAAYLVYKSFTAQIRANKQQRDDHNEQMKQLNKEHTFNYISNLFQLAKDYYYSNNRDESNKKKFVINIYEIARITRNDIDDDLERGEEGYDYTLRDHDKKIDYSNQNIINQLLKIKPILENMDEFLLELNKSDLDSGITKFYYREVERMLYDMQIWKLSDNRYFQVLQGYDIISKKGTQQLIDECNAVFDNIVTSGIKLKRISEYVDE